ncbi:Inner membrane lipoprotein YiaD precursor [Anaerohalosphaera lusitana]|uniref:Inner membrane lipoprotein YiaD n=1 Tax=Anaerohalosphaera lusitana TaxID=1936003 RepID=A0A1U9NLL8_9BACT|nr:OmpA family protein [Anaerohalosphaera lusitana]AQT68831.1 Inner membrane lipoprotein YiaD precursor [Anaerohalosphaera lusitana]
MIKTFGKVAVLLILVVLVSGLTGCTDWKKKYNSLNVEHQNLQGLYEGCVTSLDAASADKARLSSQLNQSQKTIDQLQQEIEEMNVSPGEATGFGEGMDVAVDAEKGTITVTLPNAILFAPGKASLKKATSSELDHILNVLNERYAGKDVDVVGHTDSDPIRKSNWDDNWQLSAERALSVLRYLNKRDLDSENLRAVACGASRPVASNSTVAGKAKNRRVEIVVHAR